MPRRTSPYYSCWMRTDTGAELVELHPIHIECSRVISDVGGCMLTLPGTFDAYKWCKLDHLIEVWRTPVRGRQRLFRTYFHRYSRYQTDEEGEETVIIGGPCVNDILRRRIVAYAKGTSQARKVAVAADNLMKDIVDENMISATDTDRNWARLTVAADLTLGPTLTMDIEWRPVLQVLQDIAEASRAAGTEVFFDVETHYDATGGIALVFRTMTGQPGRDITGLDGFFGPKLGNLKNPFYEGDQREEVNVVYGLGTGEGADRTTSEQESAVRVAKSYWNRCEGYSYSGADTANAARESARTWLELGQPHRRFGGDVIDVPAFRYGIDWDFGDKATAKYRGMQFSCLIRAVALSWDSATGEETIRAQLDYKEE